MGASGGILVVWNSSIFIGSLIQIQQFAVVVEFVSRQNNEKWTLVAVYGPCQGEARDTFVSWLYNLSIPVVENWLLLGDFNFIRSIDNRNLPRGDLNDMFSSMRLLGIWDSWSCPSREELSLGLICKIAHSWSN